MDMKWKKWLFFILICALFCSCSSKKISSITKYTDRTITSREYFCEKGKRTKTINFLQPESKLITTFTYKDTLLLEISTTKNEILLSRIINVYENEKLIKTNYFVNDTLIRYELYFKEYKNNQFKTKTITSDLISNSVSTTESHYNDNLLVREVDFTSQNDTVVRKFFYDDRKNLIEKHMLNNKILVSKTVYEYDSKSNLITEKRFINNEIVFHASFEYKNSRLKRINYYNSDLYIVRIKKYRYSMFNGLLKTKKEWDFLQFPAEGQNEKLDFKTVYRFKYDFF